MNPAVLLIDMQEYFIAGKLSEAIKVIIPSQLEVLTYCAQTNVPVIVVEYSGPGPTIDVLLEKCKSVPRTRTVIKRREDGFDCNSQPNLNTLLRKFEADYLVLMGIYAGDCVKETARGAFEKGYKTGTSADLIADRTHPIEVRNMIKNKIFAFESSLEFYKYSGDFFNTHKDLIAHLEAIR